MLIRDLPEDTDGGIDADLFIAPAEPPPAHPEIEESLFREELQEAEADKRSNSSKGKTYDIYPD